MDDSADRTRVEWREWGEDAFDEAARRGCPVLCSLSATWCSHCHRMDAETYAEPRIAANVNDGFVPVRVDVDRHPRVRERYNMGGFPSTVFLTPEGTILTGAGYLGPDGMRQVLDSVREMWDAKGVEAGRVPRALQDEPTPAGDLTDEVERRMVGVLRETFDPENGGWGSGEKFPMPRTIEFALKREREQALRTLDAVAGNLLDRAGGFYRFAEDPDWGTPHRERLLDTNAALVRAFAHAYCYTGDERYRDPAAETVDYLIETLWNGAAFGGSQAAADPEYHATTPDERSPGDAPRTDLTAFADWNGLAVDALLTYHAYTDAERPRKYAEWTLDTLRRDLLDDGVAVHYRDTGGRAAAEAGDAGPADAADGVETGERGLLTDQARVLRALLTAREVLGADTLGDARAVADHAVDALRDDGVFRDGPTAGPGLLDRPFRPLDTTVELAEGLLELSVHSGEAEYRDVAETALSAFAGASDRFGPRVAGYAGVVARLQRPVLEVHVADTGSDLHRAAHRIADHEAVVVPDSAVAPDGTARVVLGDRRSEAVETPDALDVAVRDLA